jgi:hypothetical protein
VVCLWWLCLWVVLWLVAWQIFSSSVKIIHLRNYVSDSD